MANPESRWITGLNDRHLFMIVFQREGIATIFTKSNRALESLQKRTIFKDIRLTQTTYEKTLIEHLRKIDLQEGRIGFLRARNNFQFPKLNLKEIQSELPKIHFELELDNFSELIHQKSSTELVFYRYGAKCTDIAAETYIQKIEANKTERELFGELFKSGFSAGGITEFCAVSINSNLQSCTEPTINPSLKKVSKKDFILSQLSVSYGNCPGYILFPLVIGSPDPIFEEVFSLSANTIRTISPLIKPGRTIKEIFMEARELSTSKFEITEFISEGNNHYNSFTNFSEELKENQLIIVQPRWSIEQKEIPPLIGSLHVVTEEGGKKFQNFESELK